MKRIFALLLSLAVLFSCLAVTAGAMFDPSTVYDVKAQSAYIVNTDTNIIVYEKDSEKQVSAGVEHSSGRHGKAAEQDGKG